MKSSITKKQKLKLPTFSLFLIAIVIVLYFLPREAKYKYSYIENRPWQYGLLTAPFNFYIHKSDGSIQAEKDSIMERFQPYYLIDANVENNSISLFVEDAKAQSIPAGYINYVSLKLGEIYKAGIIPVADYDKIQQQNKKQLLVSNKDNVFKARHITSFYTAKLAYDKILIDAPSTLDLSKLKDLKLNDYLGVNILFDDNTSSKVKEEMLKQVALYSGEVLQGEKIINRGEIVTARIKDVLDSYNEIIDSRGGSKVKPGWLLLGEFIMISMLMMALFFYLYFYRLREHNQQKTVIFILLLVVIFPIIVGTMIDQKMSALVYVIPFAVPTILVRTFIDSRTGMTTHIITVLICALMLPIALVAQFIIIQLLVGYTTIFSLRHLSERSQLVYCSLLILATYIVGYTGWILTTEGDVENVLDNKWTYVYFGINFIFVSFAYLLVYMCERVFGFMSEVSMIELSNTNRPLLQHLSETAPGTFQHSMQVSNLVVPAALRIGANPALVRVGALYHDIGKMNNPVFFTENQTQGMNPHVNLPEIESAKIIIGHVEEGVRIAKKYKLPQQIIDFIETHHGKGKAKYFFNSYANKHPEAEINEEDFTYPGRDPFSKETALLMMADSIEAASRSLKEYTPQSIRALVDKLVDSQVNEGLFKYAPITFKDIEDAKEVFTDKLVTIYHTRISYPELIKDGKRE